MSGFGRILGLLGAIVATLPAPCAARPLAVAVLPGPCAPSLDPVELAARIALETGASVLPDGDPRVSFVVVLSASPCEKDGAIRVMVQGQADETVAGPVALQVANLGARLQVRVVALWVAEVLRGLVPEALSTPRPGEPKYPAAIRSRNTPRRRSEPQPPAVEPRVHASPTNPSKRRAVRLAAMLAVRHLSGPNTTLLGGQVLATLRIPRVRFIDLQLDLGGRWGSTGGSINTGLVSAGLAIMVPLAVSPLVSFELGPRGEVTWAKVTGTTADSVARVAIGQHGVSGTVGGVLRALLCMGRISSMVELEAGAQVVPFRVGLDVGEGGTRPPLPATYPVLDGFAISMRMGAAFE